MKYSSEKITAMATLPTIPMIITLKRITTPILLKKKCKTTVLMFWIKLLMKKMKPPTPMTTTTTMMMMTMMMMLREEIKSSSARIATTIKRSKLLYLYCVTSKESITRLRGCVITLASWCFWLTVKPRSTQPSVEDIIRSLLTPITSVSGGGNLVSVTPPISIASVVTDQEIEIGVDIATFAVAGHESVLGLDFGNFAFINQEIGLGFAFAFGVVAEVIIHSEFSSGSMFATFFQSKWASGVNLAFIFEVSQLNSMNEKEVESLILKVLRPQLCLDPTPVLDMLCGNPVTTKLNWGLCGWRKMPKVTSMYNNKTYGKKICIIYVLNTILPLSSKSFGPEASITSMSLLPKHQQGVWYPRVMQDHYSGSPMNAYGISLSGQDFVSCIDTMSGNISSLHGKSENQDARLTPSSKRARQTSVGLDGLQRVHLGSQLDKLLDISWKNSGLHPHPDPRGLQYGGMGGQKYPQRAFEGFSNQDVNASLFNSGHQESTYAIKGEQTETFNKTKIESSRKDSQLLEAEKSQMDAQQSRLQQRFPQNLLLRSHFPQTQWYNLGQPVYNDPRKEDQIPKLKLAQSPRVSAVPVVQSPVSSKSGEFSSGSFGQHFNAVATTTTFGSSQKEKGGGISGVTVGGLSIVTSSPSDSIQWQHQGSVMKRKSNSFPRTPAMSGVGSPATVSNMIMPTHANSVSVSTLPVADLTIPERFSKIDSVAVRHQVNSKKNKVDDNLVRKPMPYSTQVFASHLANALNNEDLNDPTCTDPMSKSPICGSMNIWKTGILTFVHSKRRLKGTVVSFVPKAQNKLLMSEKQSDGEVTMQYNDVDDGDFLLVEWICLLEMRSPVTSTLSLHLEGFGV